MKKQYVPFNQRFDEQLNKEIGQAYMRSNTGLIHYLSLKFDERRKELKKIMSPLEAKRVLYSHN